MIVASHQPLFIPWIGYFDKIKKADIFVIADNVQYTSAGWIKRNTVKTSQGPFLLSVPIKKHQTTGMIYEIEINQDENSNWMKKHLGILKMNYSKTNYYNEVMNQISVIYERRHDKLSELNIELIKFICSYLDIQTPLIKSSEINASGSKTDLIIDICKKTEADKFMLGMGGSNDYAIKEKINSNGIEVIPQNFKHPIYKQLFGPFMPNLSIIDLIFNEGPNSITYLE